LFVDARKAGIAKIQAIPATKGTAEQGRWQNWILTLRLFKPSNVKKPQTQKMEIG